MVTWTLPALLTAVFLAAGSVDDLRSRKIHNPLVLALLGLALVAAILLPEIQLLKSAQSFGLVFALGLALFATKVWGGGDAKLFLAVSPLLIPADVPIFLMWSLFWGALMGLTIALLNGKLWSMVTNLHLVVLHRRGLEEKHLVKVPFSVALLFGHLSVVMLHALVSP